MIKLKTLKILNKYNSLLGCENPTDEDKELIYNIELELAKSLSYDFSKDSIKKLAKILLVVSE